MYDGFVMFLPCQHVSACAELVCLNVLTVLELYH